MSFCLAMACCLLPSSSSAQEPFYFQYDEKDGLPSSEVYGVEEDELGFLWFITDRGLARFDGYEFQTVQSDHLELSQTFTSITKLNSGRIYLSTLAGQLCFLEDARIIPSFQPFAGDSTEAMHAPLIPADISESLKDEDSLLFRNKEDHEQYYSYSKHSGSCEKHSMQELEEVVIHNLDSSLAVLEVGNGAYWLIETRHWKADGGVSSMVSNAEGVRAFCRFSDQNSFVGLIKDGIYQTLKQFPSYYFRSYFDPKGQLWVLGRNGIYRFKDPESGEEPDHFLQNISVLDLKMDREGNYWVCTQRRGVLRIPSFEILMPFPEEHGINANVTSIGRIDSLMMIQNHALKLTVRTASGREWSFGEKKNRSSWTNSILKVCNTCSLLSITNDDRFSILTGLPNGMNFAGRELLLENGDRIDPGYRYFSVQTYQSGFLDYTRIKFRDRINYAIQDETKTIWIGGLKSLYRIDDYEYSKWKDLSKVHPNLAIRISDLKMESAEEEQIWVGTLGNGLMFLTRDSCYRFSIEDGLCSNMIQCLQRENDSVLWVGTVSGLNKLVFRIDDDELTMLRVESYGRDNGLSSNRINAMTWWNDELWIATNAGIMSAQTDVFVPNQVSPMVILEEVKADSLLITNQLNPKLEWHYRNVQFKFLGISNHKPFNDYFYRYKLQKAGDREPEWSYTNDRSIQFTNLESGAYTFELQAQNNYANWSENPIAYRFAVEPHYTQTWWFLVLMIAGGLLLAWAIFYIRLFFVKREMALKLEIQDSELRLLRTQMSPHFVFNLLNGVQQLIFDNNPEKASFYLSRIARLLRNNMNFSKQPYISLKAELEFLENYLTMEQSRFDDQFIFTIRVAPELKEVEEDVFVPPFMVQPLLENAIGHGISGLDYQGKIELNVSAAADIICFEVLDNGRGFEEQKRAKSDAEHALGILRNRIRLLNAEWPQQEALLNIEQGPETSDGQSGVRAILKLPRLLKQMLPTRIKTTKN